MCGLATALHLPSIPSAGFKASLWVPTMPSKQQKKVCITGGRLWLVYFVQGLGMRYLL